MYLVFTHMPGESYRRRLRSLLFYLCYVFQVLINSLVFWFVVGELKSSETVAYDSFEFICLVILKILIREHVHLFGRSA